MSNWSFFLRRPLFTSMLLFYRLPLQSGLGPIWRSGLLAIWLYCWWSVAVPLEEPVGGGTLHRRCELQGFNWTLKSVFRCSNKAAGTGWGFAVAQEPLPSQVGPQVAFHILQTAPQRGDVYYDAKPPRRDAITTLSCYAYCMQGWMQRYRTI